MFTVNRRKFIKTAARATAAAPIPILVTEGRTVLEKISRLPRWK
jgi:hypothetical protein